MRMRMMRSDVLVDTVTTDDDTDDDERSLKGRCWGTTHTDGNGAMMSSSGVCVRRSTMRCVGRVRRARRPSG